MESMEKEFQELVKKKREVQYLEMVKRLLKIRFWFLIKELVVSIIGFGLIIYHYNIWLALGIWLVLWSNNMMVLRQVYKDKGNMWKELWKDR